MSLKKLLLSMRYIMKETGKKPVFIGVVVEI